jgi:hypothetical protein
MYIQFEVTNGMNTMTKFISKLRKMIELNLKSLLRFQHVNKEQSLMELYLFNSKTLFQFSYLFLVNAKSQASLASKYYKIPQAPNSSKSLAKETPVSLHFLSKTLPTSAVSSKSKPSLLKICQPVPTISPALALSFLLLTLLFSLCSNSKIIFPTKAQPLKLTLFAKSLS